MHTYIAYYRVSTDKQGLAGLGMDAQRDAVARYVGAAGLAAEYTEVESGRRTDRPQLLAAIADCRRRSAVLVIAKLDRLARNVALISRLMDSGLEFVACDMPQANRLTIHILAAVAEHEREMISQRTRAALQQAKARGVILGNPRLAEARAAAAGKNRREIPPAVLDLIRQLRAQGISYTGIAEWLNVLEITSPRGCQWHSTTVVRALKIDARPPSSPVARSASGGMVRVGEGLGGRMGEV